MAPLIEAAFVNEHQLQKLLTAAWLDGGIPLGGETLTLVAWEVMLTSWRINDARRGFGEPAIDFLGVDTQGALVAIELKTETTNVKDALRACCQVSRLAALIDRSKSLEALERAHQACFSGAYGRTSARTPGLPQVDLTRQTRSALASPRWSAQATQAAMEFGERTWAANVEHLRRQHLRTASTDKVCLRYGELGDATQPAIECLTLPDHDR